MAVSDPSPTVPSIAESYEACRVLTRRTAHNFRFSFLTLPREQRRAMNALYAFNRITDDLGDDESFSVEERRNRLAAWRESVRAALTAVSLDAVASFNPQPSTAICPPSPTWWPDTAFRTSTCSR